MTLPHPSAQPPQPSYLAGAWEAFYEGDFQWATRNVPQHARTLERFVQEAPRSWQTTVRMLVWGGGLRYVALMGLIYQCAGELYSTLSVREHSQEYATYASRYLDNAEDAWVTLGRDTTTNHMRFTMTRIQNERATFLANQGKSHAAQRALGRAQDYLAGSNIRHKKDYYLALSGLNIANGNVLGACAALSTSLNLHEETNSRSNFVYMFRDVAKLKKMSPENNAVLLIENRLRTL